MNQLVRIDFDKLDKIFPKAYFNSYPGCAEPGYDDNPVITADWNHVPNVVFDRLESSGYACEWLDEWIACDECYKVFRCSPDSYQWEMSGIILDGYALCLDCIDPEEYYTLLENNPKNAVTWPIAEKYPPEDYNYQLVKSEFENGWYPGQNDNPVTILKHYQELDSTGRFLFVIDGQGQFDLEFSLYKRIES